MTLWKLYVSRAGHHWRVYKSSALIAYPLAGANVSLVGREVYSDLLWTFLFWKEQINYIFDS